MTREEKQRRIRNHLSAAGDHRDCGQLAKALQHMQAARQLASGAQKRELQERIDAMVRQPGRWR